MDKNKLILPVAIIIAAIIIGGFLYAIQINKQESIERQQQISIQQKKSENVSNKYDDCIKACSDMFCHQAEGSPEGVVVCGSDESYQHNSYLSCKRSCISKYK